MMACKYSSGFRGVMVHASAIAYRDKVLLFLGPSGTGKSTISQLLTKSVKNVYILADDISYLEWQDGKWQVAGDTSSNFIQEVLSSPLPVSNCVPLKAVFRLYQALKPRLQPVPSMETDLYLMNAFFEVSINMHTSNEERKTCFSSLSSIARSVQGYTLYFDRSIQSSGMVWRAIFAL